LAEFSLVVLTMLFVSERSWKHHFVTLLLPITYLTYRVFEGHASRVARIAIATGLLLYAALMSTTSPEVGRFFAEGEGHEVALYFGLYFWSSVVLYALTCWRLLVENRPIGSDPLRGPHFVPAIARGEEGRPAKTGT
jgi:hypothetical protein